MISNWNGVYRRSSGLYFPKVIFVAEKFENALRRDKDWIFPSSPHFLCLLGCFGPSVFQEMNEAEIQEWSDFARDLRKRVRWDVDKIEWALVSALKILPTLARQERADLLKMGRVVAERSSKLAVTFLRMAPKAASSTFSSFRPAWIRWAMGLAEHSRETLLDFLEKSPEILGAFAEEECSLFLNHGLKLAARDPSVSYKYFINLPRIQKEIERDRFLLWFEEGISLLPGRLSVALAYFGLESKRSWDRGQENTSSVSLGEISRILKLFAQALTGRSLGLRTVGETRCGFRHPFGVQPYTDGETIFLPAVMHHFATSRLNFLAFKLATAHQAGCVEFGTFTFQLSSVHDLFPPEYIGFCLRGIADKGKEISSLEAFFHLFPKRNLAQDLFSVLEGARVDHCLQREYRGLKGEIELFLQTAMKERPAINSLPFQEALLESILRITLPGGSPTVLARPIRPFHEEMFSLLAPLFDPGATVNDSARATVLFYRWLSALPNIRWVPLPSDAGQEILPPLAPLLRDGGREWVELAPRGEEPYRALSPLPHWGEIRPELVQKKMRLREVQSLLQQMERGVPLSPEALKELLEKELEWELEIFRGQDEDGFQGLFVTDLKGLKKPVGVKEATRQAKQKLQNRLQSLLEEVGEEPGGGPYFYDEWDYGIQDYRVKWCCLKEKEVESGSTGFVEQTLESYVNLVSEVRRQFQMLKPERFKKIPHLERGDEIDLNAAIEASVDRRAGQSPSEKIYIEKNRKDRDFSTLFLLDMSASTDERVGEKDKKGEFSSSRIEGKKVMDIEREALVVMAEALEEIGDEYAIFGFSGYGRKAVDFYFLKDFREGYDDLVKGRIEKIKPQRSTRMGPAIRHAVEKMAGREARVKNLILISDGYPQDYDYGEDRSDKEYALQDTMIALEEAARKNIHTFCITVDRAGHDYLRKMLPPSRYLVIEETAALPRELPKIYRRLTT
jgi:nitric oxide reductase NorD protein